MIALLPDNSIMRVLQVLADRGARKAMWLSRITVDGVMYFLDSEYQITVGSGGLCQGKAAELLAWQDEFARADDLSYVRTPETIEISFPADRAAADRGR